MIQQAINTLVKMTGKSENEVTEAINAYVNGQHISVMMNITHPVILNEIAQTLS